MTDMRELSSRSRNRIEYLKDSYVSGDLSISEFELFLDAAFDDEPPFFAKWFLKQPEARHKRYVNDQIYVYRGEEYVTEENRVVLADSDEIDRVINVQS